MTIKEVFENTKISYTEIEIFLSSLLGKDRSFLKGFPETRLTKEQVIKLEDFFARRKNHEPVAYILGYQDFFGLRFKVNKNVLIPRPETEILVEQTINYTKSLTRPGPVIVDVGTGSGCIAVSLAKNLTTARILATDIDAKALKIAKENAKIHEVPTRINFLQGDLLSPIKEKVDIIVANLPYIPTQKLPELQKELTHEPKKALDGGKDGMKYYKKLFQQSGNILKPHGKIFYEIENGRVLQKTF